MKKTKMGGSASAAATKKPDGKPQDPTKPGEKPKKKHGWLYTIWSYTPTGWLVDELSQGDGGVVGAASDITGIDLSTASKSVTDIFSLPSTLISILKWVAIGLSVLIGVLVLVFIYRFAMGTTPDIVGGVTQIASVMPQAQIARAAMQKI
jgi:hypothetical protein